MRCLQRVDCRRWASASGGGNISQQQPSARRLDSRNERAFSDAALGSQYRALDPVARRTGG